jgi:hypothetical protein
MSYKPNCGDWQLCPCCGKYFCSKYDRECSKKLCEKCYRNRDSEREEKTIFTMKKEKKNENKNKEF